MGSSNQHYSSIPVTVQTVLRIRPFLKRERDDPVVLKPLDTSTVVMGPQPAVQMLSPSSALVKQTIDPENNYDQEFYFDHVLPSSTTQEDMYFSFGSCIAQQAMEPLKASRENDAINTSLIITMGLSNSGKTFSCWGDHCLSTQKLPQDGMLPRISDSLFSQSTHFVEKKQGLYFGVQISIVQVGHRDGILNDLLKSSSRRSIRSTISSLSTRQRNGSNPFPSHNSVMIEQDPLSLECRLKNQQQKLCLSWEEARLTLRKAVKIRHDNAKPGHVLVQFRPVLVNRSHKVVEEGGQIAVLEMESLDNGKKIKAGRIKDSIPNRADAYASIMQCLRVAIDNQNNPNHAKNVPFVQHKVTMLLQSLFSQDNTDSTNVTVLVTAYPGDRDYTEKKDLLSDLQPLRQKFQTNAAFTGMSRRNTSFQQEVNESRMHINRKGRSRRTHSHDYSSGGEKRANEEKNPKERKSPGKLASGAGTSIGNSTCMQGSLNRNLLTKYVDASVEEIVPVPPPPVAPGYKPDSSSLQQSKLRGRSISPLRVAMSRASAPVEENILSPEPGYMLADFPGVSVPQSMIARKETKRGAAFNLSQQQKPVGAGVIEEARSDDDSYINFMSDEADPSHSERPVKSEVEQVQSNGKVRAFDSRKVSLEDRVIFLSKQNEHLRAENERLRREFACLKQSLENTPAFDSPWKTPQTKVSLDELGRMFSNNRIQDTEAIHYTASGTTREFTKHPLSSDFANRYL